LADTPGEPAPKVLREEKADKQVTARQVENLPLKDEARVDSNDQKNAKKRAASGGLMKMSPGPSRDNVQSQVSNSANRMQQEASGRRQIGGKIFDLKQGVWYDAAYHGQRTINVRRGTVEYKKLDAGIRTAADSLGGIVVMVWHDKAYRIQ
jgi:hypothetical protein